MTTRNETKHFAAMVLIGDGMMALVRPEKSAAKWEAHPKLGRLVRGISKRPGLARLIGVAQIAGGIWWALRQEKSEPSTELAKTV